MCNKQYLLIHSRSISTFYFVELEPNLQAIMAERQIENIDQETVKPHQQTLEDNDVKINDGVSELDHCSKRKMGTDKV